MDKVVKMQGITKRFPGVLANDSVDFSLIKGETHALVGENGAGKSTLMKILFGQYEPDQGEIFIRGQSEKYDIAGARAKGIGMVHQNFMQIPSMSIVENIILGHAPSIAGFVKYKEAKQRVSELLKRFGMKHHPEKLISALSVGERQKIEIIKALYFGAEILILDEPTAVLTPQESAELFSIIEELKTEGKSMIFISHKLREVIEVGDRITVMRKGKRIAKPWLRGQVSETEIAQAMIGKQDVQLIKSKNRHSSGTPLLEVDRLWAFDKEGIAKIKSLSFVVKEGEILGIGGVEGNGQSELLDLLIGIQKPSAGTIVLQGKDVTKMRVHERRESGMGYVSDDRMVTGLSLDSLIEENLICGKEASATFSHHGILKSKTILSYSKEMVENFDIRGIHPGKTVRALSGGNMQKIVLAREISREPKILIAAQPTRGLDIGAINFVRSKLLKEKENGVGIILVSADLEELMSLSDRIIILYEGNSAGEIKHVEQATETDIGLMMGGISPEGDTGVMEA